MLQVALTRGEQQLLQLLCAIAVKLRDIRFLCALDPFLELALVLLHIFFCLKFYFLNVLDINLHAFLFHFRQELSKWGPIELINVSERSNTELIGLLVVADKPFLEMLL